MTLASSITAHSIWIWFSGAPLHVLTIISAAIAIAWVGNRAIKRIVKRIAASGRAHSAGAGEATLRLRERATTTGTVLRSTVNAAVVIVATVMVLGELGLNVAPIVASASVLGLAIALGTQTIVRDMVAGLFLLLEDQFGVGDTVIANDVSGRVESVGLRVTTIRDDSGMLWYLRNGDIVKVGNKSQPE